MKDIGWLIVTLAVGMFGGQLAIRLKIPAGMMIGSMAAVAIFSILTPKAIMPSNVKILTQIISGIFIGVKVQKKDIRMLRSILIPVLVSITLMIVLCMGLGFALYRVSRLDLPTALLGCAPGGLVDITMLGMDLEVDIPAISVMHVIRLVTVLSVFPAAFQAIFNRFDKAKSKTGGDKAIEGAVTEERSKRESPANNNKDISGGPLWKKGRRGLTWKSFGNDKEKRLRIAMTAGVATVFGILGKLSGIPAGAMIFSMISISAFNCFTGKGYMPITIKRIAQLLAGALIGSGVTMAAVIELKALIIPVVIILLCYFIINTVIAALLFYIWHFDLRTAFFCCTPGGASDISLMAEEFGGDTVKISLMQTLRSLSVISFYSFLIKTIL